ncbi:rhomboid family intramembrane serine protease [Pontibacter sp. 172403-2]|uniref:rhomboid family intramembrane serine protease n=1 Tax=Pontibacter rufus TaxID=2791028 RepID=UPI0018AFC625|nr:rhomboid family intramembrane serine protease [Pontibacter sp. 172403-2]MBF9254261.1 rhomboid family intramembrane serine protease [Pontibacter sp. 172403-2]
MARSTVNLSRDRRTISDENDLFAYSFLPGTLFVALLWLISLLSYLTEANLVWLGIFPRSFFGLIGVLTAPLIHEGLVHLLSNSFPLVLLSGFILYMHRPVATRVLLLVYVLSGLLTWFIGRQNYHVGASGVVYGMAGYLLFNGFLQRNRGAMAVSLVVLFLYSGLFYGLFPTDEQISWEGHLGGILSGLVAAILYGNNQAARVALPAAPVAASIAQRHLSSTIGYHYRHLQVSYTVLPGTAPADNRHSYVLHTTSFSLAVPTKPAASSSKRKRE